MLGYIIIYALICFWLWIFISVFLHSLKQQPKQNIARNIHKEQTTNYQMTEQDKALIASATMRYKDRSFTPAIESKKVPQYQQEIYTDSEAFDTEIIAKILSDATEEIMNTKSEYGVLTSRVAVANKKQEQKAESISIKAPDTITCAKCEYRAKSIKALNGHMKRHSTKREDKL